jgi:hypothetical protein
MLNTSQIPRPTPSSSIHKDIAYGACLLTSLVSAYMLTAASFHDSVNFGDIIGFPIIFAFLLAVLATIATFVKLKLPTAALYILGAIYLISASGVYFPLIARDAARDKKQAQSYIAEGPLYALKAAPPNYKEAYGGGWFASVTKYRSGQEIKVATLTYQKVNDSTKLFVLSEFTDSNHQPPTHCNYDPRDTSYANIAFPACEQVGIMPTSAPIWRLSKNHRDYLMTTMQNRTISMMVYLDGSDFTLEQYIDILKTLNTTPDNRVAN